MRAENQLPKNIRQIGGPVGTTKVYIEDFVVTFLKALTTDKNTFVRGAILFGEKKSIDNETVIFIRGAVEGQNIELDLDETVFDDKVWREIYQKKERFFPDLEVIGWALSRMGFSVRLNDKIKKTHFENFPGDGKVLYMTDHLAGDDAFYVYRGQDLVRQSGYYIYYEKNPMMQEYLIERNQKLKEAVSYETMLEKAGDHLRSGVSSAIGYSSVLAAANLNAKCIITPSVSGATARVVSNLKPRQEILGVTPNERTLRRMSIYWGVRPLKSLEFDTTEDICDGAIELALVKQYIEVGDVVVLTAGIPSPSVKKEKSGVSNMMRIATIE